MFRLSISNYQEWFQESLIFWVQSFRTESMHRVEKALEIDKDVSYKERKIQETTLLDFFNFFNKACIRKEITVGHTVNQLSLVHNYEKAGNKCYTQDNTNTPENPSVRQGA